MLFGSSFYGLKSAEDIQESSLREEHSLQFHFRLKAQSQMSSFKALETF